MSQDICQKERKNQTLSRTFDGALEDSEVSYLSNALLVEGLVTMQPNVLIKISLIKVRNQLNGTKNRTQVRRVIIHMKTMTDLQIVMKMNMVMIIYF